MRIIAAISLMLINFSALADGWVQKADHGGNARHRTTMLTIGNSVYFGLGHYNGAGPNVIVDDWWEYSPSTNAWTQKADYAGGNTYHAAGFTIGNLGYVGTGRIDGSILVQTFFEYDPLTNSWTQLQNFPGSGRRGGVAFSIDGYGYMGSGSYTSDFYRYDPTLDQWSPISPIPTAGRISSVAFELGGYGYVGTGNVSGASNDFWRYDPASDLWTAMAPVGPTPRMEACGFAVQGKGYILTGDNFSSGTNYKDMWEYDPITNAWTQFEDFPGTARRYMAASTMGDVVYVGSGTNGTNFKDFWMFNPVLSVLEKNIDRIEMSIFPNPSVDHINIDVSGLDNIISPSDIELSITSLTGATLHKQFMDSEMTSIETVDLQRGAYICTISYEGKILKSEQLVIQ